MGFYRLPVRPLGLFFGALVLGGLAFLNTWDILIGFALLVGSYALVRALESGWAWKRLEDVFTLGVPLGLSGDPALPAVLRGILVPGRWYPAQPGKPDPRCPVVGHVWSVVPGDVA